MRLRRFRLKSLSSFQDTEWIELSAGMNLILGQNNAGKSALLRAFDPILANEPHRNETIYQRARLEGSQTDFDVEISGRELESAILETGNPIYWPIADTEADLSQVAETISARDYDFQTSRHPGTVFYSRRTPSHGLFPGQPTLKRFLILQAINGRIAARGATARQRERCARRRYNLQAKAVFIQCSAIRHR